MPAPLLSRDDVVARVMAVLRQQGYDGASLSELSRATGLGKSSLYHHFPDGKDDMVGAVLAHLEQTLEADLFAPLRGDGPPAARPAGDEPHARCLLRPRAGCVPARQPRHRRIVPPVPSAHPADLRPLDRGARRAAPGRGAVAVGRPHAGRGRDCAHPGAVVLARSLQDSTVFARTLRALPTELLRR